MNDQPVSTSVAAINPRGDGHRFVWYADCALRGPEYEEAEHFSSVNRVFQRLEPMPDHVVFVGDNIWGGDVDAETHRQQWLHWNNAMAWFWSLGIPMFQTASNHNTANALAEEVFRETFPDLPRNGAPGQEGLSYSIRRGDLLLVVVDTNFSGLGGSCHVEHEWLDGVLTDQADAMYKIVVGHHPIHPVNGHTLTSMWCVDFEEGAAFWEVLVRHNVLAYTCSHILAFDVQVHDGIPQVLTGGAGAHVMRLGMMPDGPEYFHLVNGAIDSEGLRLQAIDTDGVAREWFVWPMPDVAEGDWTPFGTDSAPPAPSEEGWILRVRIRGTATASTCDQVLVVGWQEWEGPEALKINLAGHALRLEVELVPEPGRGAQRWLGPTLEDGQPIDLELAIHSRIGPGGVLARFDGDAWASLRSTSNRGAMCLAWPDQWVVGHGPNGANDSPYHSLGESLCVEWALQSLPLTELLDASHDGQSA